MITCNVCSSTNIKVNTDEYASKKPESEASLKSILGKRIFTCMGCSETWESSEQSQKDYEEYRNLCQIMDSNVRYVDGGGKITNLDGVMHRTRFARKIKNYRHLLDLEPKTWYQIAQHAAELNENNGI